LDANAVLDRERRQLSAGLLRPRHVRVAEADRATQRAATVRSSCERSRIARGNASREIRERVEHVASEPGILVDGVAVSGAAQGELNRMAPVPRVPRQLIAKLCLPRARIETRLAVSADLQRREARFAVRE